MWGRRARIAGSMGALWIPIAAAAADLEPIGKALRPPAYDWTITIGVEGRVEPSFQGSDRYTVRPYPWLDVRPFGTPERFHGPRDGFGVGLIEGSNFQIGPVGQYRTARRESDDPAALHGLGNVPWAVEVGAFAEYWWVPWLRTRAEVRQGFNGHHGVVADIFMDAVVPVNPQLTMSGGPRVTFATTAATRPYFSINEVQSAASGLPVFAAEGGVRSIGAGALFLDAAVGDPRLRRVRTAERRRRKLALGYAAGLRQPVDDRIGGNPFLRYQTALVVCSDGGLFPVRRPAADCVHNIVGAEC